jgi:hypothetical protein
MAVIPGLPTDWTCRDGALMDLSLVPAGPTSEHDPLRPEKVAAWGKWASEVSRYRRIRTIECRDDEHQQELEIHKIKRYGPKYFITMHCKVHEPRSRRFNEVWAIVAPPGEEPEHPGWLPAIGFEYQYTLIDWVVARLSGTGADANGVVSKPRDVGASWWVCLVCLWYFLFKTFSANFVSRREGEVHRPGKLNCLFGRLSCHILLGQWKACTLPEYLLPKGWIDKEHLQQLIMIHPENENIFIGESTSARSGRGDRAELGVVDEAAHIAALQELIGALSQTVDHLLLISSEYAGTTDFWGEYVDALKRINPASVFEIDYWMHPFHDEAYLEEERERMQDDVAFAREILRDREAGFSGWLYEMLRTVEPLEHVKEFEEGTLHAAGFDPGQDDETALVSVELNTVSGRDTVLDAYAKRGQIPEWWAVIFLGCDPDATYLDPLGQPYNFQFTHRERDLIEHFRALPQPTVYADPYGENSIKKKGENYYNDMRVFAMKYNWRKDTDGNPRPLSIVCGWDHDQRHFQKRRIRTLKWLSRLDWNPTPDVLKTLHAMRNSKFDDPEKGRQAEQRDAKHDGNSHRRTSIEFIAVNLEIAYRITTERATPYQGIGTRDVVARRDESEARAA